MQSLACEAALRIVLFTFKQYPIVYMTACLEGEECSI